MTRARRQLVGLALALAACGAPAAPPASETGAAQIHVPEATGPVVATVDGEAIHLSEVEEAARVAGISPRLALVRLEQERVLSRRAAQAGITASEADRDATRRAAVQALLRARVEDAVTEASVPSEEIAARYEASRASWARPERRASVHLLAAPRDAHDAAARAAAQAFVAEALTRLAGATDPASAAQALASTVGSERPFTARVETLPATSRHGSLEEPYLAALFELDAPGLVPHAVTTSYGVHAVVLTSIEPAFEISLAEATPILRRQLLAERRHAALDALTDALAQRTPTTVDERVLAVVASSALDLGSSGTGAP
ncbi:MAG: peptidyl-prolyl cis-trans isomerase [Sandaracinus sp.]